ncbi:heme-binding domain-containing protein [Chitinophaga sp. HK235]|uniref:heme-binding domain-containing protein n=1 Tax=Chitinophaga sp. HK235 TaxID=2952571 RepID=UPI001BA7CB45|nr:heme-binding domain-containing protein [Chitinophaga sp. HK235]
MLQSKIAQGFSPGKLKWWLLGIFVVIQFFRPSKNQGSQQDATKDVAAIYPMPDSVQHILQLACYDCHSNHTRYPWYAEIQPIGWLLNKHIQGGKKELNFQEYGEYSFKRQRNKLKRMKEQIISKKMPLPSYTLLHPEARLTHVQQQAVITWIDSTLTKI